MDYVTLGNTSLKVSALCLGTMMFGGKTTPEESGRILRQAMDAGVNFIDTADAYNEGHTEEVLREELKRVREQVVLASKVGMRMGGGPNDSGASRRHIVRGVEASLRRLGTDWLDLLYIHWPTAAMNLEEMARALDDLVRAGKVLYPACSNFPAWLLARSVTLQELQHLAPFVVGQYPYNLIERGIEVEVLPLAAALKLGIVVYRPLSAGVLTAKYLEGTPADSRGTSDNRLHPWTERYAEGIRKLRAFAEGRGYSAAHAAIAWVRSHPAVTAPIVGISSADQFEDNLKAFTWQMTPEEREEVSGFFPTAVWEESGGMFPTWRRSFDILQR